MTQNYFDPAIELASRDYLHALQSARLIKMVENCYNNVPFYKKKFDEIGLLPGDIHSIDDITKLPFTVKQDLRDNYPFGLFAVSREKLQRIHASSGTTGKQTVVGYTKHDIDVWAHGAARAIAAAARPRNLAMWSVMFFLIVAWVGCSVCSGMVSKVVGQFGEGLDFYHVGVLEVGRLLQFPRGVERYVYGVRPCR